MQNTLRNIFATKRRLDLDNYLKKNHVTKYDEKKQRHIVKDEEKNTYLESFLRTGKHIRGITKHTRSELGIIDLSTN